MTYSYLLFFNGFYDDIGLVWNGMGKTPWVSGMRKSVL